MKNEVPKKKNPAQEFFDGVRLYDTGADFEIVESIFKLRRDIEDNLVKDMLSEIENIDDYGLLVKRTIYLGPAPEEPNHEAQQAERHLQFSFLRELEHDGVVKHLREITKEEINNGSQWIVRYAEISFYPKNLKDYLIEELPAKRRAKNPPPMELYIVKDGDDYRYNGALLDTVGKETNYRKVFDVLYSLLPTGGSIKYGSIGMEIRRRIPTTSNFSQAKMNKFIQSNLDGHNGFLHHAKKIDILLSNGKKLIKIVRGSGIEFNNKKDS